MSETKIEPYFGGFVLETLTVGMYGESRNALREYVQNAFDSVRRAHRKPGKRLTAGLIKVTMGAGGSSLTIHDNGAGLPRATAVKVLTSIGASGKDYKREAGFRGIGRLSGIVFTNQMIFSTKAAGENVTTVVTFDAKGMREAMKPDSASELSAEAMITTFVTAKQTESDDLDAHFFEVQLVGFEDAPEECTSAKKLEAFLSQVAPVPYSEDLPEKLKVILKEAPLKFGIPVESVELQIIEGKNVTNVVRPYGIQYEVGREPKEGGDIEEVETISLSDIHLIDGTDWWGWWGDKERSGQYGDSKVSGIRVRVKNIQIDGVDVFRDIFRAEGKSHIRFQEWYVGEIFVKPEALVPNARRDGFEENQSWKKVRREWRAPAKAMIDRAYEISDKSQTTIEKLREDTAVAVESIETLRRAGFRDADRALEFAAKVTKIQKQVAKASKSASPRALPDLQALSSELFDIRTEVVSKLATATKPADDEKLRNEIRQELIEELLSVFESEIEQPCLGRVRSVLRKYYS